MLLFAVISPFCVEAWFSLTCGFLVRDTLRGLGIFTDKILYGAFRQNLLLLDEISPAWH